MLLAFIVLWPSRLGPRLLYVLFRHDERLRASRRGVNRDFGSDFGACAQMARRRCGAKRECSGELGPGARAGATTDS
jgi:hypothetical protein